MYHRWATDVIREGDGITHVVFTSKAGRQAIRASQVIDATGDGDVFTMAGEPSEKEQIHPWLWFRMSGVRDVDAAQSARAGFFFRTVQPGQVLMPWGAAERIARRIDATDPDDLTFAEVECRRMVMDEVARLRAQVPGFEDAYLTDVALTLGVTESRRLTGAYTLARDDAGRVFDDTIATTGHWTKYGAVYHIPYRSLLPQRDAEPARRGPLHQRRPSRAPRDEGDPARVRDGRGRRHRRHACAPRVVARAVARCGVAAVGAAEGGGVVARMYAANSFSVRCSTQCAALADGHQSCSSASEDIADRYIVRPSRWTCVRSASRASRSPRRSCDCRERGARLVDADGGSRRLLPRRSRADSSCGQMRTAAP